jgi:MFS family permease
MALRYVGSQPLLLRLFLIAFCGIGAFASMEAVFGLWTARNFGWGTREVGLTFLAVGGAGLLVQTLAIGPLVAKFGEARVILGGLLLLVFAIVLPPLIRMPAASVVLMSLLMAGHSLAFPNAGALVSRTTPPDRQGSVMGLNMASNAFSRIIAPPFFGWLFALHADAPYYLCALLMLSMVPVALQVVRLRERA